MQGLKKGVLSFIFLALPLISFAYDNSPSNYVVVPECIWAAASGGGTWYTEIQIYDRTGGSIVECYFNYGGGSWRGPLTIWTSPGAHYLYKTSNILQTLDNLDSDPFYYYGRVGAVEFITQDDTHKIQVQARTWHSYGYGKTLNGMTRFVDSNSAALGREMLLQGAIKSSTYRFSMGCFNLTGSSVTVEFRIIGATNNLLGSFTKTFVGYDFQAFNPFAAAGLTGTYTNCFIFINPTSGSGKIMVFGASAHNTTNDPAAHVAVQYN